MRFGLQMVAIAAVAFAAACGGGGGDAITGTTGGTTGGTTSGNNGPVATTSVSVQNNNFTPADIQVTVGQTVTWTWSSGGITHNVTFSDGSGSGDQSSGTFSKTFSTAGTFQYRCTIHAGMNGSVLVK